MNQYYLGIELLDDVDGNAKRFQDELRRNPTKYNLKKKYAPQDNYLTDLTEELNEALLMSIRHHQMLIKFTKMLEDFFNIWVLLKSIQTTIQVGVLTYTFLKVNGFHFLYREKSIFLIFFGGCGRIFQIHATVDQYFNLFSYVILTGLDVYSLCYFGEQLKSQTSRIGDALFRCPWHLCGGPFRRIASIILANTTKPCVMTGGKFFVLDFEKLTSVNFLLTTHYTHIHTYVHIPICNFFFQILKGSFSYFTLLQNMGK